MSFDVRLGACKQHDQENMSKKLILVKPVEWGKRVEKEFKEFKEWPLFVPLSILGNEIAASDSIGTTYWMVFFLGREQLTYHDITLVNSQPQQPTNFRNAFLIFNNF